MSHRVCILRAACKWNSRRCGRVGSCRALFGRVATGCPGRVAVDPRTFGEMIRQLSRSLSRRSLVGGSLGASLLAAVGLSDAALAKNAEAEACVPAGQRCGTKKKDPPCRKCCNHYHIVRPNGTKTCACRPADVGCSNPSQCCTGICEQGTCRSIRCRAENVGCAVNTDCCSEVCGCVEILSGSSTCTCRNASCAQPDEDCSVDADCCTETCSEGTCSPP